MDDLAKLVSGLRPDGVASGFVAVQEGVAYHVGSTVRAPTGQFVDMDGLIVPSSSVPGPLDYAAVYLVIDDYISVEGTGFSDEDMRDAYQRRMTACAPFSQQVGGLAAAAALWAADEQAVTDSFLTGLVPVSQARVRSALSRHPDTRVLIARQPLLAAFRSVLLNPSGAEEVEIHPIFAGIVLSHVLAAELIRDVPTEEETIAEMPASLAIDLFCNLAFNSADDLFAQLDRFLRLWREYRGAGAAVLGMDPLEALRAATGLELEDAIALAFALFAWQAKLDRPDRFLRSDFNSDMTTTTIDRFLDFVAATPEELRPKLADQRSQWDFLAFQDRPVLRLTEGLLVIDSTFLMDRVTSGLYYAVHDWAKDQSEELRLRWTQAWAKMVEDLVEDALRPHAIPILGGAKSFYTEDDLGAVYEGKVCDVVIDLGAEIAAVEIVSGRLTVTTRIDGDRDAFMSDLEKIVFKKLRQLDESAHALVSEPEKLFGVRNQRPVRPIVVAGSGFPNSPITQAIIDRYCEDNGLFDHALIKRPVILDVGEVEMLEGLHEAGHQIGELIERWQQSPLSSVSMRNWMMREMGAGSLAFRPARMKDHMDAFFAEMMERLQLRDPTTEDQVGNGNPAAKPERGRSSLVSSLLRLWPFRRRGS